MAPVREKVTFERVFDVVRFGGSQKLPHTMFGFEAATRLHYGVEVPGTPRIEVGDTVLAVLDRPNDWQTLRGWRNLSTGEVAAPTFYGAVFASALMLACTAFCAYMIGPTTSVLIALPFLAGSAYWAWFALKSQAIRRELSRDDI